MAIKKAISSYPLGVSIVVCCYNSEFRITPTLQHLLSQKVKDGIAWEVVMVDNNCTDNTVMIANKIWEARNINVPLNIVKQPIPGLTKAREKGIETAKYGYLVFCDDDNWLCDSYISTVYEILNSNSAIGALGGWGTPFWEKAPPEWLLKYAGSYATGPQGKSSGEAIFTHHVYGAGISVRKTALDHLKQIGFTGILNGRTGKGMDAGEDHELCYALYLSGYKIWYDERLRFHHFIPEQRANRTYLIKMLKGFARCGVILSIYKRRIENRTLSDFKVKSSWYYLLLGYILYIFRHLFTDLTSLIKDRKSYLQIYFFKFGFLVELIKSQTRIKKVRDSILDTWQY